MRDNNVFGDKELNALGDNFSGIGDKLTSFSNGIWSGVSTQHLLFGYLGLLLLLVSFALFMRNKKGKPSKFQVFLILALCSVTLSLTIYVEGMFV